MWKSVAANAFSLLIVLCIAVAGAIGWGQREFTKEGPLEGPIFFEVPRGAGLSQVAARLAEAGAVTHPAIFRLGAEYSDMAGAIRAGSFEIPARASMEEILGVITQNAAPVYRYVATYVLRIDGTGEQRLVERVPGTGEVIELAEFAYDAEIPTIYSEITESGASIAYRVSIPEGLTSWQIVEELKSAEFLTGEVAEIPAEGVLAPDTYEATRGMERSELLVQMQARQEAILMEAWANRAENLPISTPQEALILASIIEKETGQAEERGVVASVFTNRLRQGMRLQTDPTVIYGVTEGQGVLGRGLRRSELDRVTPWNTYQIDGLPPTPIANPGRASIEAALNPDDTKYIFFVADGTGGHAFAETLAEHNRNVARWREIEADARANSGN
ncbi:endolytic transglycosylase MltG [Roseobacter sp. HKCCA2468]|uniref:endolytic transglycosylase MltG n=1 Tax=Roseobacter sp. HKCCA2468 TaxID=3120342 RepID=UPI0030EE10C3